MILAPLLHFFFVYSVYNSEGLPVQLNVKVGDENGAFETRVDCERAQSYTEQVAKLTFPPPWHVDFGRPCESTRPEGRKPR